MGTRGSIRAIIFPWHQRVWMISTNEVVQFLEHHEVAMIPKRSLTTFKIVELIRYVLANLCFFVYPLFWRLSKCSSLPHPGVHYRRRWNSEGCIWDLQGNLLTSMSVICGSEFQILSNHIICAFLWRLFKCTQAVGIMNVLNLCICIVRCFYGQIAQRIVIQKLILLLCSIFKIAAGNSETWSTGSCCWYSQDNW